MLRRWDMREIYLIQERAISYALFLNTHTSSFLNFTRELRKGMRGITIQRIIIHVLSSVKIIYRRIRVRRRAGITALIKYLR